MDLSLSEILGIDNEYELLNRQAKVMSLSTFKQPTNYFHLSKTISTNYSLTTFLSGRSQLRCLWDIWVGAYNNAKREIEVIFVIVVDYGYFVMVAPPFLFLLILTNILINKFYYRVRKKSKNGVQKKTCQKLRDASICLRKDMKFRK